MIIIKDAKKQFEVVACGANQFSHHDTDDLLPNEIYLVDEKTTDDTSNEILEKVS